jgi:hypothetical protein
MYETGEWKEAVEHMANLIKEAIDQEIIDKIIDDATPKIRIKRIGNETELLEWDTVNSVWVSMGVMLGDFDFTLKLDQEV